MSSLLAESEWFDENNIERNPALREVLSRLHRINFHGEKPAEGTRHEDSLATAVEVAPQATIALARSHARQEFHAHVAEPVNGSEAASGGWSPRFTNLVHRNDEIKASKRLG